MSEEILAGFVPLVDAATLIVARELGFARERGLDLVLVRQPSWALLRDHLNLEHIQCAHALAPLPIASRLGLGQIRSNLCVPFVLGRGGNAITVTRSLADSLRAIRESDSLSGPAEWGAALRQLVAIRDEPLTFAMVYPFSGHNYELRYWLATSGIHPDRDVRLISVPPSLMVESMAAGYIDGFCVGEPWNSVAAANGIGEIIVTKSQIFPRGIEKVLAIQESLLDGSRRTAALLESLAEAAKWCDDARQHGQLAEILSRPAYLDTEPGLIFQALSGTLPMGSGVDQTDFLYFSRYDANRPLTNEALWLYAQMRRWGQAPAMHADEHAVRSVFRRGYYESVLGTGNDLVEPLVRACDDVNFNGSTVNDYLGKFSLSSLL